MKKNTIWLLSAILTLFAVGGATAKTVTEGTLDIQNLATEISGDLRDYTRSKDVLVDDIRSVQSGVRKLKEDYQRTGSENEKTRLRAATLKETSDLLDLYSRFYELNTQTIKRIIPRLESMRKAARKGGLGKAARQLQDPEFKRNMANLYGNLSSFAVTFGNAKSKKEVAMLLRENELLYNEGKAGTDVFKNIMGNIDKVAAYLRSIYATTRLRAGILERKKFQAELAVELMEYALALKPLKEAMAQMNPEGIMEVPQLDLDEFVDPIIEDDGTDGIPARVDYDPEVDRILQSYQNGPGFLK